jgi:hypothetical protein
VLNISVRRVALAAVLVMTAAEVRATDLGSDRFFLQIESFVPLHTETTVRLDKGNDEGGDFTLEDDTGIDETTQNFRLDLGYRFGAKRRHGIGGSLMRTRRSSTTRLDIDLDIGDGVYPLGVDLYLAFETFDYEVDYQYFFISKPKSELAFIAGLHGMSVRFDLAGKFKLDGAPIGDEPIETSKEARTEFPIPLIGVLGNIVLGKGWIFRGSAKLIDVTIGNYKGRFIEAYGYFEHSTFRNVHFGLGYRGDDLKGGEEIDANDPQLFIAAISQERRGAVIYVRVPF